jgi:predicted DCC family thiol-disulfide oxidoreductase YuxK
MQMETERTILFDGVCNLCNASVQFIIQRDPKKRFRFASLQSEYGQSMLQKYGLSTDIKTIVLIEGGKSYDRSSAALRMARRLNGAWPILFIFILVPPFLRNAVYNFIARNRYTWFGRQETCGLPDPQQAERFLG